MEYPQASVDYPRDWPELLAWFSDEAACLRYLEWLRWGEGFVCRFCGVVAGGSEPTACVAARRAAVTRR